MRYPTNDIRRARILRLVLALAACAALLPFPSPFVERAEAVEQVRVITLEETADAFVFSGTWSTWSNAALSGGSYRYANGGDAGVTVTFEGSRLELVARKGPEFGQARVLVDGVAIGQHIDLYAAVTGYQQTVFDTGVLDEGTHEVRVEWTGAKNPAARGTYISIDAARATSSTMVALQRFEQTDPRFQYIGAWGTWANAGLSGGSYAFTKTAGAAIDCAFEGSHLRIIGRTGPEFGQARILVDGQQAGIAEFYSPTTKLQQTVMTLDLPPGLHQLRIEHLGVKNDASTDTFIGLDAIDVVPVDPPPIVSAIRLEQTDWRIAFDGPWGLWENPGLSGGSYAFTSTPGGTASVSFEGTRLDLYTRTGPEFGIALVTIDGGAPRTVDLYAPQTHLQERVYSTWELAPGWHTVTVAWTGSKNPASNGTYVGIDAVDVVPATAPPMTGGTVVEQTDPHFSYGGPWYTYSSEALSGGSYRYAPAVAQSSIAFTGTRLDLVARTGPEFGIMAVSVDDGPARMVDLYSPTSVMQAKVFSTWGLPAGAHTVRITGTGRKHAASSGTYIGIDAVHVLGELTSDPIEEYDYRILRTGSWGAWASPRLSGGGYIYANSAGTHADVWFEGTSLEWVARTGPEFGIATMSIDGGAPIDVNLYTPDTRYRQTVASTGALGPGPHTVRISWSGRKDPRASGTFVGLDAVRVGGVLRQATRRYDQTHPWVQFTGAWPHGLEPGHYGGSYQYTNVPGAAVGFLFTGTRFKLIARSEPASLGKANVYVDDVLVTDGADLYRPTTVFQETLYESPDLPYGLHRVLIECTGEKNAAAQQAYVSVDAIDVAGTLEQPPNTFTITGQGWGHSIGLSQYGAKGFAEQGWSYRSILSWFYQGTGVSTPAAQPSLVRVHLQKSKQPKSAWALRSADDARQVWGFDMVTQQLRALGMPKDVLVVEPWLSSGHKVTPAYWNGSGWIPNPARESVYFVGSFRLASPDGDFYSTSLLQVESVSGPFDRARVRWRGAMEFRASALGVVMVNFVPLDHYLYGVVPRESPASWHIEALKAQAVAARSYAYDAVIRNQDLACTTASQVYGGHSRDSEMYEQTSTNAAVDATSGQYVMYGSKVVQAFFSSSSGGHTANIEDVWTEASPQPYFRGVSDPYGVGMNWGPHTYTPAALAERLGHAGSVVRLSPEYAASGHVKYITITYSDGSAHRITGDSFRSKLGLNSTHFQLTQQ